MNNNCYDFGEKREIKNSDWTEGKGCVGLNREYHQRKNNGMSLYVKAKNFAGKFLADHVLGLSWPLFAFGSSFHFFQKINKNKRL